MNVIMAAALTSMMAGRHMTFFIASFVCCSHLLWSVDTVNAFATRGDIEISESRNRLQGQCKSMIQAYDQTIDPSAVHVLINTTKRNAEVHCLENYLCTTYVFINNTIMYSTSAKLHFIPQPNVSTYEIRFRCPRHQRCSNLPCNNGSTCVDLTSDGTGVECICDGSWKGWYCELRKYCRDHPCLRGATCRNTGTDGFNCTCPAFTTGVRCEVQIPTGSIATTSTSSLTNTAIVTEVTVRTSSTSTVKNTAIATEDTTNKTAVESGLTTETKVVIAAVAIVITGVAGVAVIGTAGSTVASTAAGAAAAGGGFK